jgi:hypothetical protein
VTITWLKRDHLILWLNQQAHALHGIVEVHWHFITWTNKSLFTSLGAFLGDFKDVLGLDTVVKVYPFFEDVVLLYMLILTKSTYVVVSGSTGEQVYWDVVSGQTKTDLETLEILFPELNLETSWATKDIGRSFSCVLCQAEWLEFAFQWVNVASLGVVILKHGY